MASKTDKNTVKTVPEIPDTLAEFVEQHEELAGCPEFVPAHEFSVAQTCDFMVVDAVASDSYGVFRKKTSDDVDSSLAIARMVAASDSFFEKIAKDVDAYHKWVTGRTPAVLVQVFTLLNAFYSASLGKSEASRTPTGNAK